MTEPQSTQHTPQLTIRPLRRRDYGKAVSAAIRGMHFNEFTRNPVALWLYGRYFWYDELNRATKVIAAYYGDEFAGVLLASMKGEPRRHRSFWSRFYVKLVDALQRTFFKDEADSYDEANARMLKAYTQRHTVQGEIGFLAANPDLHIHGVGTLLLREFERREYGRRVFLYTDSNCTWQFYEHRGFTRVGHEDIPYRCHGTEPATLECYLYTKVCGHGAGLFGER